MSSKATATTRSRPTTWHRRSSGFSYLAPERLRSVNFTGSAAGAKAIAAQAVPAVEMN
jgi:hypothetical protein